jgi:arylsulfatase A-like enzyme
LTFAARRRRWVSSVIVAVAAAGCAAPPSGPPDLVLITIDTLRADRLGCYGYFRDTSPELDRLARNSILFERCLTPIATTFPAHLSLFTSTYPGEHGSLGNVGDGGFRFEPAPGFLSFAQVLQRAGYRTAGIVSAIPVMKYSGLAAGFDFFSGPSREQRTAEQTNAVVLDWLQQHHDAPYFLWVHYFDPHSPYGPPGEYASRFGEDRNLREFLDARQVSRNPDRRYPDSADLSIAQANSLYDGEIAYLDRQIGRLLDALRAHGEAWRNTVVVVVGDHGEGLGQHDEMTHGGWWGEQLHVPLLMRIPGQRGRRVEHLISVADVLPTLLGMVELPGEDEFLQQASGVDRLAGGSAEFVFSQEAKSGHRGGGEPRQALTGDEWKLVHDPDGTDQLFRLTEDPYELRSVHAEHADVVAALRSRLDEVVEDQRRRRELLGLADSAFVPEEVDAETLEELRALGYTQ